MPLTFKLFISILVLFTHAFSQTVKTQVGTFVGFVGTASFNGTQRQVVKYIGIPYGEPTDGENRFSKPKQKSPLADIYFANRTDLPNVCPQVVGGYITAETLDGRLSEDCLYLSIYAPKDTLAPASKKYAVMIWIHGGSFVVGLSDQYTGDILSGFHDVIVVTINYRLNAFGFFSTGDEIAPGNYGLWDQHLAIKWVHEHIDKFGGDPNEITIFGGSSGSSSALFQAMFPGNKGLFNRVIAQSRSAYYESQSNMVPFANFVGCNQTSSIEIVSCLRSMNWETLSAGADDPKAPVRFAPVRDGDFIKKSPVEMQSDPNSQEMQFYSSLDIIFGVNDLEGAMFMLPRYGKVAGVKDKDISWIALNVTDNMAINRSLFEDTILPSLVLNRYFPGGVPKVAENAISAKYSDWMKPNDPFKTRDMLMDLTTDLIFHVPSVKFANAHFNAISNHSGDGKTYFYEYTFFSDIFLTRPEWMRTGADHADEILSVFGFSPGLYSKYHVSSYIPSSGDIKMSSIVMKYWTNFAKTGNPNAQNQSPIWPTYTKEIREYMQFTTEVSSFASVRTNFGEPRISFWIETVPALIAGASRDTSSAKKDGRFSDRLNINSTTAENIIIALAVVSSALLLCLLLVVIVLVCRRKRDKYVTSRKKAEFV